MKADKFDKLMAFLDRLEKAKISYRLSKRLDDAIRVDTQSPGEHWEVDFLADGEIYVERFRSDGHIDDESALEELFRLWADKDPVPKETANQHDAVARK